MSQNWVPKKKTLKNIFMSSSSLLKLPEKSVQTPHVTTTGARFFVVQGTTRSHRDKRTGLPGIEQWFLPSRNHAKK
jgi:hypothetical protein